MLGQTAYEIIRWLIAVVLPAIGVLFSTLANAWGWDLPVEAILTTISGIGLFLGTIFGISKVVNDNKTTK